jgi:hypothetical protein
MRTKGYTTKYLTLLAPVLFLFVAAKGTEGALVVSDESAVREEVRQVFEQLKSGRYGALYDTLPSASRARISRERFTSALERTQDMYRLERMETGAVRVSGDIAVADTVMYGRLLRPVESDGKIVVQQYLVREEGRWRVATGDRATVRRFLAANPSFAKKFPIREPRFYMKRDGRWVDVSRLLKSAVRRQTR